MFKLLSFTTIILIMMFDSLFFIYHISNVVKNHFRNLIDYYCMFDNCVITLITFYIIKHIKNISIISTNYLIFSHPRGQKTF